MIELEDLIIDPEFADQIPPLDPDEYEKLEANILEEGAVINAIVVWKGERIIVDGHHRYRILKDHPDLDISYTIYEKEFPDRYAAQAWMCSNQLGRRNLTPEQKKYLIGKQYEAEKASHGGVRDMMRGGHGKFTASDRNCHLRSKTRERVADETKMSEGYVANAAKYARGVDLADEIVPGTRQEILSRKIKPSDKDMAELLNAEDPEDRKKLIESFHEERKPSRPPIHAALDDDIDEEDVSGEIDGENNEESPVTDVTLRQVKEAVASLKSSDGQASEDDVIYELTDALNSLMYRWDFCVEMNPKAARGPSFRSRRDELIKQGIDYLHNFKSKGGKKKNESQ